jgi:hypothetical protein
MTHRETALVRIVRFWAKWITSGLLTRDQSEVDSDLTDPRPFLPSTDACQFGTPTLILTRGLL